LFVAWRAGTSGMGCGPGARQTRAGPTARRCAPRERARQLSARLAQEPLQGGTGLAGPLLPASHGEQEMAGGKEGRMPRNNPTLPLRIGLAPDATTDPDIYPEAPSWPPAGERPLRPLEPDRSALLWLSLGATGVAVVGLLGLLLLN